MGRDGERSGGESSEKTDRHIRVALQIEAQKMNKYKYIILGWGVRLKWL